MRLLAIFVLILCGCDAAFTDLRPQQLSADGGSDASVAVGDMRPNNSALGDAGDVANPFDQSPGVEAVVAEGMFTARATYGGEGRATLVRLPDGSHEVRLGADFSVGSVPGPVVVLAREDSLGPTLDPARGDLELGVLMSNSGAGTYPVPGDPGDRRIVWIYCKPFGIQMTSAAMEDQ